LLRRKGRRPRLAGSCLAFSPEAVRALLGGVGAEVIDLLLGALFLKDPCGRRREGGYGVGYGTAFFSWWS